MCPDRQIISLYLDGELPSPWKEKMESHMEACPECRGILSGYDRLGKYLKNPVEEIIPEPQERVWKKLIAPELVVSKNAEPWTGRALNRSSSRGQGIWKRTITMPLPAAAAAIVIVILMVALFGFRSGNRTQPQNTMAAIPEYMQVLGNDHGMVPTSDMSGVLQYLSSMDNGDFMVIRLPESKNFIRAGEPAFINAADYSRRRISK